MNFLGVLFVSGIYRELPTIQKDVWNSSQACGSRGGTVSTSQQAHLDGSIRIGTGAGLSRRPFCLSAGKQPYLLVQAMFSVSGTMSDVYI